MSDETPFEPCQMITIGTVIRNHPTKKGERQVILPNTLFTCDNQEDFDRLTSRRGRALPTARVWSEEEAAPPPQAEGDSINLSDLNAGPEQTEATVTNPDATEGDTDADANEFG